MTNYFSNLPKGPTLHIFQYLDVETLADLRQVDQKFKKLADTSSLYTPQDFELKESCKKYVANLKRQDELNKKITGWKRLNECIQGLRTNIEDRTSSLFGRFVSWIEDAPGMLEGIAQLFRKIFPCINQEIETRKLRNIELEERISEYENIDSESFRKNLLNVEEEGKLLQSDYEVKKKIFDLIKAKHKFFNKMKMLFGGKEKYEALPVLDIQRIELIQPHQMSVPMMRGIDEYGRHFFSIRYQKIKTNAVYVQTFFERPREANWICISTGENLVDSFGYHNSYEELHSAIAMKATHKFYIK